MSKTRSFTQKSFAKHAALGVDPGDVPSMKSDDLPTSVLLFARKRVTATGDGVSRAMERVSKALAEPAKNPFDELKIYREYVPMIIKWGFGNQEILQDVLADNRRLTGTPGARSGKRWTSEEDRVLIDLATADDAAIIPIATTLGRSPQAISSRLTYLVGISRVTQEIAGRITGYIDGNPVDGQFVGTITKNATGKDDPA